MFCKNCGQEINDNAVICVHCGVAVTPAAVFSQPAESGASKFNVCALLGFIFSIVGLVVDNSLLFSDVNFSLFYALTIAGLVLSIIGAVKSKKLQNGKGFGIAGIVISSVSLLIGLIIVLMAFGIVIMLWLSLIFRGFGA